MVPFPPEGRERARMRGFTVARWLTVHEMAPTHLVVDGSNIATEGRSLPSLKQLDEAVRAFLKERPHDTWTVVVDATFEHRIDSSEKKMFEEALAANEMVIPPAGTIGRGDKFLLEIADRANATVFSNDSFQEFHGEYTWLFDDGRLVGGKPVAEVGWIFTERTPVRGPKSRMATRSADRRGRLKSPQRTARKRAEASADLGPLPVPTEPPPRGRSARRRPPAAAEPDAAAETTSEPASSPSRARSGRRRTSSSPAPEPVNDPLPFIEFIAEHGPGSTVEGEVTSFASHGAYVQVGDVRCYLELKLMGDPPPNAAREVLNRGEVRTFVVQAIDAPRRGIDLALPGFEQLSPEERQQAAPAKAPARKRVAKRKAAATEAPAEEAPAEEAPAAKASARKRAAKKAPATEAPAEEAPAAKAPARKRAAKKKAAATEAPVEEATATAAPAAKAPARKRAAKKAPATEAPAEEAPAAKAPARKRVAKRKAPATEAPAEEAPAAKAPARKRAAKKAPAKEVTATSPGRGRHRRGGGGGGTQAG